jgi:3-deoxy-manno-octulosonate cytidylyltransferase (CMP-KDO synthetase)
MFTVIIPARYGSTRLPGKALLDIAGEPMVVRVAQRALSSGARAVVVATDTAAVFDAVKNHGLEACLTRADHVSGTDRIAEAAAKLGLADDEIVVNVQGDEPLIEPELIDAVARRLVERREILMSTACYPISSHAAFANPNIVKVVLDRDDCALYFSRASIPFAREAARQAEPFVPGLPAFHHVGLYAYRAGFLAIFPKLAQPDIERFEALEQLRALWHGYKISVVVAAGTPAPGVDTAEDLQRVRAIFDRHAKSL